MKQIVCKRFWGLPIRIVLTDETLAKDEAIAMVSHCNGTFEVSFRGCQSIAAVVHETYHLFMDMLEFVEL